MWARRYTSPLMGKGMSWVVSVKDNGIGFEQDQAARVLGLFKRLHTDEYPRTNR